MDIIREKDIPTCSLIGITEVVVADRPDATEVVRVWQIKRMASSTSPTIPVQETRSRPLLVVVDEPTSDRAAVRVKLAIEKRLKEQTLEQPAP